MESITRGAEDRVKELNGFMRLGKARDSEVYTAKAYAAGWRANVDKIEAAIRSARQELSYLTGHDVMTASLVDEIANTITINSLDDALARGQSRTDLRAQREEVEALKLRIRYKKGSFWPSADVTGNYYTKRATFLDKIDWDVVLSVDVPFFQGGKVSGAVKEAYSIYRQAMLELQRMERYVDYSIRKTHGELEAAIKETVSREEATRAAQQSYDSLRKEYRLGLVTNLDVLQAMDFLQTQKTQLDAARIQTKLLFIQLNVEMDRML
jgi:outer membrane protein